MECCQQFERLVYCILEGRLLVRLSRGIPPPVNQGAVVGPEGRPYKTRGAGTSQSDAAFSQKE